ncbi:unnamed protein product [Effrenium voratum]|nr:unnamed protein product [Effrenium voratum]
MRQRSRSLILRSLRAMRTRQAQTRHLRASWSTRLMSPRARLMPRRVRQAQRRHQRASCTIRRQMPKKVRLRLQTARLMSQRARLMSQRARLMPRRVRQAQRRHRRASWTITRQMPKTVRLRLQRARLSPRARLMPRRARTPSPHRRLRSPSTLCLLMPEVSASGVGAAAAAAASAAAAAAGDWKTLEAWKAEGVDIDGRSGLRRQRGGGLAARTEKSGSPLARGQRKRRRLSQPEEAREKEAKGLREVYVGGLCWSAARKEVIIRAFDSAFQELPEYRARYAGLSNPIVNVHFPQDQGARSTPSVRPSFASTFAFVEFVDTILARTALELSGLQIGGRSARICQASAGMQPEGQFLDVEPLRQQAKIPHTGGPGSQMLLTVWIGSFPQRIVRDEMQRKAAADAEQKPISDDRESFAFQLGAAALQLPGVRQRYPELRRPVLTMRFSECNRFAFTDFSTELLASSVVAAGQLSLENGMKIRTGWPVGATNAEERAPPPLAEDGSICAKPQAFVASVGAIHEEDLIERMDCEVFLGGVQGLEVQDLWSGLTKLLSGLQSYNAEFGHLSLPIVNMRLGTGPFAFARMADPRLASTAIALGEMVVNRRMVHLRRPSSFHDKPAAPLDLNPKTSTLPLPPPPKLLTTAPDPVEKENPPAPPAVPPPTHSIWVGNLPGKADLCGSDDEDTSNQELLVQRLDQRLVELAMKLPSYDFEDGPPIKRISMHHSLSFAFVEIVGSQERVEELMSAFDNKDFMGKSLEVNWSRRRKDCLFMRQFPRRSSTTWVADVPKGILQLLPDMAKRIEGYAKSECAMQIDQL